MTSAAPALGAPAARSIALAWAAPAAWGTGLITTALGAASVVRLEAPLAARGLGMLLVAIGVACLAWGAWALREGRVIIPRAAIAVAAAIAVVDVGLLLLDPVHTSVLAIAIVLGLDVSAAGVVARSLRRSQGAVRQPAIWMLVLTAIVLTMAVTPALSSVQNAALMSEQGQPADTPGHAGH